MWRRFFGAILGRPPAPPPLPTEDTESVVGEHSPRTEESPAGSEPSDYRMSSSEFFSRPAPRARLDFPPFVKAIQPDPEPNLSMPSFLSSPVVFLTPSEPPDLPEPAADFLQFSRPPARAHLDFGTLPAIDTAPNPFYAKPVDQIEKVTATDGFPGQPRRSFPLPGQSILRPPPTKGAFKLADDDNVAERRSRIESAFAPVRQSPVSTPSKRRFERPKPMMFTTPRLADRDALDADAVRKVQVPPKPAGAVKKDLSTNLFRPDDVFAGAQRERIGAAKPAFRRQFQ